MCKAKSPKIALEAKRGQIYRLAKVLCNFRKVRKKQKMLTVQKRSCGIDH
jgi:hypothetical protein